MNATETPDFPPSLLDIALFYAEAGVDEAIGEQPVDRTVAPPPKPQPAVAVPAAVAAGAPPPASPGSGVQAALASRAAQPASVSAQQAETAATQAARACNTIAELEAAIRAFDGCALKATATNTVIARGNPQAKLMIVGEAPGRDEDAQGLPFVGESGQLLDKMLKAIGRDESNVYISNLLFWRPPGNRDPSAEEIVACRPFIERLIELVNPKVLVCTGKFSTGTLLGTTQGITRVRGRWHDYKRGDIAVPAMPMLHPAYLLRQPGVKREAWRDMLELAARLDELGV
ncbi:MAG: uracil-DNA glycosylase [Ferrovibrio sp.]|uniref:uracil-DNA glycosylase n=1 Tax=Ferrovibrio sp. TaxID=1917215 RepID=UPI002626A7AA|nr:uracil-DNA glycosylase [Ferrovibrio sp.]MCW0234822.1 uracil-DNA glycosylase [Ferrovibrio sp.]